MYYIGGPTVGRHTLTWKIEKRSKLGLWMAVDRQRLAQWLSRHDKRSVMLPDIPTAQEAGVAGLVAASWNGLAAPARTPPAAIARLNRELVALLAAPDIRKKLHELNVEAMSSTPQQAADLLASDVRRWGEVITRAKIPLQ